MSTKLQYPSLPNTRLDRRSAPKRYSPLLLAMDDKAVQVLKHVAAGGRVMASVKDGASQTATFSRYSKRSSDFDVEDCVPTLRALVRARWLRFAASSVSDTLGYFWLTDQAEAVLR